MAVANNDLKQVQTNDVKATEYWSARLLKMIVIMKDQYVFHTLATPKEIPANQGTTTYSMRRYNHLPVSSTGVVTPLVEGTPSVPLKVEAQKVQAVLHQYGNYIEITDWVDAIHFDNIIKEYQPELARIAIEEKELKILDAFAEASEYYVGGKTSKATLDATDVLTLKDLRKVITSMKVAKRRGHSKYGGKFVAVVHSSVMQDLLEDGKLVDNILSPGNENSPMKNGSLETYKVYGFFIQETLFSEVAEAGSPEFKVFTSYVLGENPYILLTFANKKSIKWHQVGFGADKSDPLGQKATIGYTQWFGAKVIDTLAITRVYSRSEFETGYNEATDILGRPASQV